MNFSVKEENQGKCTLVFDTQKKWKIHVEFKTKRMKSKTKDRERDTYRYEDIQTEKLEREWDTERENQTEI